MKIPQREIDWAVQVAEKLPEKYQQTGFAELLRYALTQIDEDETRQKPAIKKVVATPVVTDISTKFPDLHLLATQGNRDQHVAWGVAELYSREEDVNNNSIRKVIQEHLAITPPGRQNTNRSLRNLTPKYIPRTKVGRKYYYSPAPKFSEIFKGLEDEE